MIIKINVKKVIKKVIVWKISPKLPLHGIQGSLYLPLLRIFEVFKWECKSLAVHEPIKSKEGNFSQSYLAYKVYQ